MAGSANVSATELKQQLGKYLDLARTGRVIVERQGRPIAVLISIEEYEALNPSAARTIELLTEEFDALVARMQEPSFHDSMERALASAPAERAPRARRAAPARRAPTAALASSGKSRPRRGR